MTTRIAIVAATQMEIQPLVHYLDKHGTKNNNTSFQIGNLQIDLLISGIGVLQTTYSLMNYLATHQPDKWIQAGIGGAFDHSLELGKVYVIESEILIDVGAQEKDGSIMDPFALGWIHPDDFPFTNGKLVCKQADQYDIPSASGMTTSYAHGSAEKIENIRGGLHGRVESMEGAAFFYVSLMKGIPFVSIRAISNYVEPRDKDSWQIDIAINALSKAVINLLELPHQ